VVLVVDDHPDSLDFGEVWGSPFRVLAETATAFAMVEWVSAVDNFDFARFLGHLQGAQADPPTAPHWDTPFDYGHGSCRGWPYNYKTIMVPTNNCSQDRVGYWSNPDVDHAGRKTGDRRRRNNARVLRETACQMSDLVGPALNGWFWFWGSAAGEPIHWWHLNSDDYNAIGDFDGDGLDEWLAANPGSGYSHLMEFGGEDWDTTWTNLGNGAVSQWWIGTGDRLAVGRFLAGSDRDQLLVFNPAGGHAFLLGFDGEEWGTIWSNGNSDQLDWWIMTEPDKHVSGDLVTGNDRDELLMVNPNGWARLLFFDGSDWDSSWDNDGSGSVGTWSLTEGDRLLAANFDAGNGRDELLFVNEGGWSRLLSFDAGGWEEKWNNGGSDYIRFWHLIPDDRYVAGDLVVGDDRDELLALNMNGTAQFLSFDGDSWEEEWSNGGAGNIGLWYINPGSRYAIGDFQAGTLREELLSLQPLNGWAHLHLYSP
ncbi:MAG: hypothetical protein AAF533_29555, partial [Acidobacteriota bacterium]